MSHVSIEPGSADMDKNNYKCDLCTLSYVTEKELREHFWSLMHHTNIEKRKKNSVHNCTLCFTACNGIAEYRKHLNGEKHKKALEENRNSESSPEMQEPEKRQSRSGDPNQKRDGTSDDEESGGFSRDPFFYKKKESPYAGFLKSKRLADRDQSPARDDAGSFTGDPYMNYWGQAYDPSHTYGDSSNVSYPPPPPPPPHFGDQNMPFQYGWLGPRMNYPFFTPPPQLPFPRLYMDFERNTVEGRHPKEPYGIAQGKNENSGAGGSRKSRWDMRETLSSDQRRGKGEDGSGNRKGGFQECDTRKRMDGKVGKKKKKKKKLLKQYVVSGEKNHDERNLQNSNGLTGRKRGGGFDSEVTVRKTSRLAGMNVNASREKDKISDPEEESFSSSVASSSSYMSKSSGKSYGCSPSVKLKSRKLHSAKVSPKFLRNSQKVKQIPVKPSRNQQEVGKLNFSEVLEKAEKLCLELREQRQKAKQDSEMNVKLKKNEQRNELNKQIRLLNYANKSRIKGHLEAAEESHGDVSGTSVQERKLRLSMGRSTDSNITRNSESTSLHSEEQQIAGRSDVASVFRNDIDRIRHNIENSVRKTLSSPARLPSSGESPKETTPKNKKPLSKDALLKMVNSPRSRNERMHLARMLRTHAKNQNKLTPSRLNVQLNGLYDNFNFDEEDIPALSLEDLSPEVKLQIAQLIEDDVITTDIDCMESTFMSPAAQKSGSGPVVVAGVVDGDCPLSVDDLENPRSGDVVHVSEGEDNPVSISTEQVTVTSINGVPQLQIVNSPTPSDVLSPSFNKEQLSVQKAAPGVCSGTLVATIKTVPLHVVETRASPTSTTAHKSVCSSDIDSLMELTNEEGEKERQIEELDQKIDLMRQMLKRTLEHLERNEERRKELCSATRKIRERKLKILKDMSSDLVSESRHHPGQPVQVTSAAAFGTGLTFESMDIDPVSDVVSSTSQQKSDLIIASLSRPDATPQVDFTTRPVSKTTVSTPCSSFDTEATTNPSRSRNPSVDERPSSSLSLSCVSSIKQKGVSPTPEKPSPIASLWNSPDGSGAFVARGREFVSSANSLFSTNSLAVAPSSITSINNPKSSTSVSNLNSAVELPHSQKQDGHALTRNDHVNDTRTTTSSSLAGLSSWSPLADRLSSVSGSKKSSNLRASACTPSIDSGAISGASIDSAVKSVFSGGNISISEVNSKDREDKDSTSSGFGSVPSLPRRTSTSEIHLSNAELSKSTRSLRSRTVSESSDRDNSRKSNPVAMTYLGTFSGMETSSILKKLAADLGSFATLNSAGLDKPDASFRGNAPMDQDVGGKETTPREESDQSCSITSNCSLGEKIRMYCKDANSTVSLNVTEIGLSDGSKTLREEDNQDSDNTPSRTLKHCSVILQKLDLERLDCSGQEDDQKDVDKTGSAVQTCVPDPSAAIEPNSPASPGKKKRKTRKERDSLSNLPRYRLDSSSDNNSQDDENLPKLSLLKQRLHFSYQDDATSKIDQDVVIINSTSDTAKESKESEDQRVLQSLKNNRDSMATSNANLLQSMNDDISSPSRVSTLNNNVYWSVFASKESVSVVGLQIFKNSIFVCFQGADVKRYSLTGGEFEMCYDCSNHGVQCMSAVSVPGKDDSLYAGGLSLQLLQFTTKTSNIVQTFRLSEEIKCMHSDSGSLYVGLVSGAVEVFDVKTQKHKDTFQCAYQPIHCITSAREGGSKLICVSARDTTISVCDARSGLPVRILEGHTKTALSVVSSDHFVFSGSGDRTVMMHNLHTGTLEYSFKEHNGIITSVWVEGNTLFSAGYDRLVRCFDIKSRKLKKVYYGAGKGVIMSLVVQGHKLFTGSRDGCVECLVMKDGNWTCKMENCLYVFGERDHLEHHLLTDHILINSSKTVRCTWKHCSEWVSHSRDDGSVESHMKKHVDSLDAVHV